MNAEGIGCSVIFSPSNREFVASRVGLAVCPFGPCAARKLRD